MSISAEEVKKLREITGAGFMECKKALTEANGDVEGAIKYLRERGVVLAAKKATRKTDQGIIGSYVHMDKIGVLVEVNCETDFVAKNNDFRVFVKDVAMHIAAAQPVFLKRDDVPQPVIDKEREIYGASVENKPPNVKEKNY
jgi:elongation factor Ts